MRIDAGNFGDCVARIAEKGKITAGQALDLLEHVADRAEEMRRTGVADPYVAAAGALGDKVRAAADRAKLDALRNAQIRSAVMAKIEDAGGIGQAEGVLRSLLHGTNAGDRDSIESQWKGLAAGWQALLSAKLRKAGVEDAAVSGQLDREVARALWAKNSGVLAEGVSGPAKAIADAIHPLLDQARDRLNGAGAQIGDAADYVAHTTHDPAKLRAAAGPGMTPDQAFAAWWRATEPKLAEKTFADLRPKEGETAAQARDRFGRSVFDALVSGIHMTPDGALGLKADADGYVPPAFEGSRNLAKQLSQERVLFWKDGDAWHDYMRSYGTSRSLTEGVMQTLDRSARSLALMEKLGTNPTGNFNLLLRRIQETYRDDLDGVARFQTKTNGLENVMAHLDGSANIPANQMWARLAGAVRTWESMSSLGGVGITHFASIWPTVTSELVHHGVSRWETLGNMVTALLQGRGSAERQTLLSDLGAYAHGLTGDMRARWQAEDTIPGRVSTLASIFMKHTGIHYVFDNIQAGVRELLAHNLGRSTGQGFDALDGHLQQILGKYGIGSEDWDLLRGVGGLPVVDGRAYLTPKDALRVDPAAAEALLRGRGAIAEDAGDQVAAAASQRYIQGLSDKLYAYYNDAAAHAVVTPGVRERALILGAEQPGTFGGELRRFVAQFKMWPLAATSQIIGREIHLSLTRGETVWNLGVLAGLSALGGYLRMSVNDAALGHPLRSPLDPRTLAAALAQGGGVGILGDFLFGETNRFGGGLVGTVAGPVIGDADQLVNIFNSWKRGDAAWPDLAHLAVRHVPFANLVYLKGALDYLVWYHLYEAASPGWWERTNRRLLREQGRTMAGYAPGQGIPWTPWGLGSGANTQPQPPRIGG